MNTIFSHPKRPQQFFFTLLYVTVALSWIVRLFGIGWFFVFFWILLLIGTSKYIGIHKRAIVRISSEKPGLLVLSNILFFLCFALQSDFGDDSYTGGIAIFAFLRGLGLNISLDANPTLAAAGFFGNILVFLLLIGLLEYTDLSDKTGARKSLQQQLPALAILTLLIVILIVLILFAK